MRQQATSSAPEDCLLETRKKQTELLLELLNRVGNTVSPRRKRSKTIANEVILID